MENILLAIIALTGSFHIAAFYVNKPRIRLFFKPLTTILIIILALLQPVYIQETYRYLILGGLIFSLIGDVLLVLPKEKFIPGLISFFIAHVVFIIAFTMDFGFQWDWVFLLVVIAILLPYLWVLLRHTKKMTIPVAAYAVILTLLLWQALTRFWYFGDDRTLYIFLGAFLFVFSDAVLAYDKFVKKFKLSEVILMVTYWSALILFAFSV
jgi:uncharacterized membrane protein YhhN